MLPIKLFGSPGSLFTGRVRSYFINAGIEYEEASHMSPYFINSVLPKAGGRHGMPTIELPDGFVIRDSVAIVDYFEEMNGRSFSPITPKQRIVSRLLDAIGSEGFLRPAMHYRWNFDAENKSFVHSNFLITFASATDSKNAAVAMRYVKEKLTPAWGVVPETYELIESLYLTALEKFDLHFSKHPYFLGGKPCIGDFGMMSPLFGHLGRDPKPLSLMQTHAGRLFRWVERMNRRDLDLFEFNDLPGSFNCDDEVGQTLLDLLKHFSIDFIPESLSACNYINEWLDENAGMEPLTEVDRGVGMCEFEVQGVRVSAMAQPFRFFMLKKMQDEFFSLKRDEQSEVAAMLSTCDMSELINLKLSREIGRHNNLEVWL